MCYNDDGGVQRINSYVLFEQRRTGTFGTFGLKNTTLTLSVVFLKQLVMPSVAQEIKSPIGQFVGELLNINTSINCAFILLVIHNVSKLRVL